MTSKFKTLLVGASLVAVAACGEGGSWDQPAGAWLDEGGFGNPTMYNMMAQKCAGRAKGYIVPDPVVVLDPAREAAGKAPYRTGSIRCSGNLNGKYAQVIWAGYVSSAAAGQQTSGGGITTIESGGG
ncbi:MAG: hypothetical protein HKN27_01370 [Silicimonas sp.]|nr:hypothetical protein [Silicimonas sp.]